MIGPLLQEEFSALRAIGASLSALAVCFAAQCIYDLFFHPLRKFPGPKLAAIRSYYEFYYDVIKDGTYLWEIEKMHKKYGPVVRINSKALHIHDPDYFPTIYSSGSRRVNKEPTAVSGYTFPHSTIATIDHDLHRKRRAVVSPYFASRSIVALEPFVNERLDALCSRFRLGQSTYLVNNDPSIFPNPHVFNPERWIKAAREGVNLDKYMVSFSKGSRNCLGMNLAYVMLFFAIAKVATNLDMELFKTKQQDIELYHTRGFAFPKEGSGAVK